MQPFHPKRGGSAEPPGQGRFGVYFMSESARRSLRPVWRFRHASHAPVLRLAELCRLPVPVASILYRRGYRSPEEVSAFLDPTAFEHPDPFLFKGMRAGAERIAKAIEGGERIVVYGDYDVDGQTGTALVVSALQELGADVGYYIPSRLDEGYGLSVESVSRLASEARLLVTVDCGITSVHEVDVANSHGLDCVITDHHEPGPELPQAVAVIDPKQPDCPYPDKGLAGCGVAYKLVRALYATLGKDPAEADRWLDLVALATVADVVPLVGENRAFVAKGMPLFGERPGLRALCEVAHVDPKTLRAGHIAFSLAPRLNAAGRLADASRGVQLLLTDDLGSAREIAAELDRQNHERQQIEQRIFEEASEWVERHVDLDAERAIVVAGEGWHTGVIGIVASRLVERYGRPTLVLAIDGDEAVGSGRSIAPFNLHAALSALSDHFIRFGGHSMAAGLTMAASAVAAFRAEFVRLAGEWLAPSDLVPVLSVDARVTPGELTVELAEAFEALAPFGIGNPEPVVAVCETLVVESRRIGRDQSHWRIYVHGRDGDTGGVECIGFGMAETFADHVLPGATVDVAGTLAINRWNGVVRPQLQIRDVREGVSDMVRHVESALDVASAEEAATLDLPIEEAVGADSAHNIRCHERNVRVQLFDWRGADGDVRLTALKTALAGSERVVVLASSRGPGVVASRVAVDREGDESREVFICSGSIPETAYRSDHVSLIYWDLPHDPAAFATTLRQAACWGDELHVYLALTQPVVAERLAQVDGDLPEVDVLRHVYRSLRSRIGRSGGVVSSQQLAHGLAAEGVSVSPAGVVFGLEVFASAGLMECVHEGADAYRVQLMNMQGRKVDLTMAVRYNEGVLERERLSQCAALLREEQAPRLFGLV